MTDVQPYQFELEEPLQDEDDSDCFEESEIIEESARTGSNNWCPCELCLLLVQVVSEQWTFLLPDFESGIRCSRNGGPPVIWIISLYP